MQKPELRPITVSSLIVDPELQRNLDQRRVNKIAEELDMDAIGGITVSHRPNGSYHFVDGQHRVAAVRIAKGDYEKVMCRVFIGLTTEEEARLFRLLNNTTKPQAIDLFRVRVIEGDEAAVRIADIVAGHGWRIEQQSLSGCFSAVAAAERVYRLDPVALERTIATVTRAWGHDPSSVDGRIVEGIGLVYARYSTAVDSGDMTDRLSRTFTANALLGRARALRDIIGGTVPRAVAEIA